MIPSLLNTQHMHGVVPSSSMSVSGGRSHMTYAPREQARPTPFLKPPLQTNTWRKQNLEALMRISTLRNVVSALERRCPEQHPCPWLSLLPC